VTAPEGNGKITITLQKNMGKKMKKKKNIEKHSVVMLANTNDSVAV